MGISAADSTLHPCTAGQRRIGWWPGSEPLPEIDDELNCHRHRISYVSLQNKIENFEKNCWENHERKTTKYNYCTCTPDGQNGIGQHPPLEQRWLRPHSLKNPNSWFYPPGWTIVNVEIYILNCFADKENHNSTYLINRASDHGLDAVLADGKGYWFGGLEIYHFNPYQSESDQNMVFKELIM